MRKACLVVHKVYQNNEIFRSESPLNRDNCLAFFQELHSQFAAKGVQLLTQDLVSFDEAEFIIFNEMPLDLPETKYFEKSCVFLFESELIRPNDWKIERHRAFKYIFTWNDDLVDNKKYFKFNFTQAGVVPFKSFSEKTGFCTLIAGNKRVNHPLELYSKRIEAIDWFTKYHPDQFKFFGIGWDLYTFSVPFISKFLNRLKPLRQFFARNWPLYGGPVKDKLTLLRDYKFSICYENAHGITGYITEKILDSMAAGCIPVYWGAPNVGAFIPVQCFVSKVEYPSYEELFSYLSSMSEVEYNIRLAAIKEYIEGAQHEIFEPEFNAAIVIQRILNA